jgi:hypothetical protein
MSKKVSRAKRKKAKQREGVYQPSLFEKRRGGQPGNTNAVKHGLYSRRFDPEEVEALSGMQDGVKDEIEAVRVTLSRILDYLNGIDTSTMKAEDYSAVVSLVAKNAATVGRLMQIDKALNDSANVGIHAQLLAALEDVNQSLLENS